MNDLPTPWLDADFNGVFRTKDGLILCLSHQETCRARDGGEVIVDVGMRVTAFDEDTDDSGKPDDILASGAIERPPDWLAHKSRWVLRIDARGIRHESDVRGQARSD